MAQAPLSGQVLSGAMITGTGARVFFNLTAPGVIKASAGRLVKISVMGVVGTGGLLTFNDCATLAAASTANQFYSMAGTIAPGMVVTVDFPVVNGIVCSSVPTGGTPLFALCYV